MTTNRTIAEDHLAKLGIRLQDAATPVDAFIPAVQSGDLLYLSGMLATSSHAATVVDWNHKERILDNFRRRLEFESQDPSSR